MEHDHSLGHQEPHWKEFHFDLMQIPAGEAVTAAEFRIYKVPSTHPLNTTLHVSVFEVVRERSNRCLPSAQAHPPVPWSRLRQDILPDTGCGGVCPKGGRGAAWEDSLRGGKDAGPEQPCLAFLAVGLWVGPEPLRLSLPPSRGHIVWGGV